MRRETQALARQPVEAFFNNEIKFEPISYLIMQDLPEFSRRIDGLRLSPGGGQYAIAAKPEERAALAKRFDLLGLDRLEAKVRLTPMAGGYYRLAAEFEAAAHAGLCDHLGAGAGAVSPRALP